MAKSSHRADHQYRGYNVVVADMRTAGMGITARVRDGDKEILHLFSWSDMEDVENACKGYIDRIIKKKQ